MLTKKIKALVVDDTIVYRKAVSDTLQEIPGVEVVGVAHNGLIALSKIKTLQPDLVTLDIEMPEMNGIQVLQELQKLPIKVSVIMVSTLTSEGGEMTMKALELGAYDFIVKPTGNNIQESKQYLQQNLTPLVRNFQKERTTVSKLRRPGRKAAPQKTTFRKPPPAASKTVRPVKPAPTPAATKNRAAMRTSKSEIVTIGISTGGPNALGQMLPMLPGDIGVPILIVQHMPPVFTQSLATSLNNKCAITVKEAEHGEAIQPNVAYIAPGGKQMKLMASADGLNRVIKITDDPPENSCKPAADYLFRSVGDYYVGRATAVIMTGMGSDGTRGLEVLKQKGAYIIGQDEASCVVYGMPKAPAERHLLDVVVPLQKIAETITKSVR